MSRQNKVTGVVLAGGLARRMQQLDKGLVRFRRQPLVGYALKAMAAAADEILISANRNIEQYRAFGYPVIPDLEDRFCGPLAGVLAALEVTTTETLLVIPCDSPLIQARHLQKMLSVLKTSGAEIAVADDGERLHPVFLALKSDLQDDLQRFLASGERKVARWLDRHRIARVDFSQDAEVFVNLNTLAELERLQSEGD